MYTTLLQHVNTSVTLHCVIPTLYKEFPSRVMGCLLGVHQGSVQGPIALISSINVLIERIRNVSQAIL